MTAKQIVYVHRKKVLISYLHGHWECPILYCGVTYLYFIGQHPSFKYFLSLSENQDCVGIGSITLTDDSIAALNVIQELNGHIVISGDLGEITAASLLETDGDENMLNNQELQENCLTLIAGESHTEAEPLTILTSDIENKQFTIITDDCKSSSGAIMEDNITTSFINF